MTAPGPRQTLVVITYDFPWPLDSGVKQRTFHLANHLAAHHDVTLVTLIPEGPRTPGSPACPLRDRCRQVIELDGRALADATIRTQSPWAPFPRRLRAFLTSRLPAHVRSWLAPPLLAELGTIARTVNPDVTWVNRAHFAHLAQAAGFRGVVADLDDLYSIAAFRELRSTSFYWSKLLHYAEAVKTRWYERGTPHRFWRTVVCKESDRAYLGGGPTTFVVPNGIAEADAMDPSMEGPADFTYVGTMDYPPNIDAATHFVAEIMPGIVAALPESRAHIVGRDPTPAVLALADGDRVSIHGAVPDIDPYLATATVVVAPIRLGSGTRLKVLEALVRGKAMVATSVAIEGLALRPGVDLEVADTPAAFSEACVRLAKDPLRRRALGAAGRERVLALYSWGVVGHAADRVLRPVSPVPAGSGVQP
jgi:glycosyltransferase involved in cell wall biosynthesis